MGKLWENMGSSMGRKAGRINQIIGSLTGFNVIIVENHFGGLEFEHAT